MAEIHTNGFCAVPRVLEMVYDKLYAAGKDFTGLKKTIYTRAFKHGARYDYTLFKKVSLAYQISQFFYERMVYRHWRERFGGNRLIVITGSSSIQPRIIRTFAAAGINIYEGYGLSETSPVVTMNPPGASKVGSSGVPVHNIEIRIVDSQNRDVPQGEAGELICRGENVMLGYWNLPEASGDALRGGWFHTADVARIDEDGYVYIVDRIKDMIISMGENIYPREVEEVVYQFPGIAEAAVIGIEDKLRGQAGACFYSLHEGASVNIRELKKFLQENLALYKIPREFHELPHLPRTSTGKIAKRLIWDEFQKNK
jgi:long-chain acyl-CoA synthetase